MQQPPSYRKPSLKTLTAVLLSCSTAMAGAPPDSPPVIDTTAPVIATATVPTLSYDARRPVIIPQFQDSAPPIENIPVPIEVSDEVEGNSATFSFSPAAEIGPLTPGRYILTWTATDLGLNQTTETQTLDVKPTINFGPDQTVGEGGTAVVTAVLSGPLAAATTDFPITIPYTISGGTADGTDYNVTEGTLQFDATDTADSISLDIVDDGPGDDGDTIIIDLNAPLADAAYFAGHNTRHTIIISETNHAPLAQLSVRQNGQQTRIVSAAGGVVTVSASGYDANGDNISYDWSASDNALTPRSGTTGSDFVFDPLGLSPGFYTVRLTVSDDKGASSSYDLLLALLTEPPTLSGDTDRDDDGTKDAIEGLADGDNDGIPDYLDANANPALIQGFEPYVFNPDVKRNETLVNDSITLSWAFSPDGAAPASNLILYPLMIATEPGLRLNLGPTAFAANKAYARLSTRQAEQLRNITVAGGRVSSDGQLVDIEISGLDQAGDSARIIIPQMAGIPPSQPGTDPVFLVFTREKLWTGFATDEGDQVKADKKQPDAYCPDFADITAAAPAPYQETLDKGHECLLITVEDGGPNDYDGAVNGSIRFMGGVFITTSSIAGETASDSGTFTGSTSTSRESLGKLNLGTGSGGGALNWTALLGLLLGGLLLRRRQ